jgi:hypothetical protein
MPYVTRDQDGRVVGVSEVPLEEDAEFLPVDAPEVEALLRRIGGIEAIQGDHFLDLDLDFVRVVEDLLELLIKGGTIRLADLPEPARDKLRERRAMRHMIDDGLRPPFNSGA